MRTHTHHTHTLLLNTGSSCSTFWTPLRCYLRQGEDLTSCTHGLLRTMSLHFAQVYVQHIANMLNTCQWRRSWRKHLPSATLSLSTGATFLCTTHLPACATPATLPFCLPGQAGCTDTDTTKTHTPFVPPGDTVALPGPARTLPACPACTYHLRQFYAHLFTCHILPTHRHAFDSWTKPLVYSYTPSHLLPCTTMTGHTLHTPAMDFARPPALQRLTTPHRLHLTSTRLPARHHALPHLHHLSCLHLRMSLTRTRLPFCPSRLLPCRDTAFHTVPAARFLVLYHGRTFTACLPCAPHAHTTAPPAFRALPPLTACLPACFLPAALLLHTARLPASTAAFSARMDAATRHTTRMAATSFFMCERFACTFTGTSHTHTRTLRSAFRITPTTASCHTASPHTFLATSTPAHHHCLHHTLHTAATGIPLCHTHACFTALPWEKDLLHTCTTACHLPGLPRHPCLPACPSRTLGCGAPPPRCTLPPPHLPLTTMPCLPLPALPLPLPTFLLAARHPASAFRCLALHHPTLAPPPLHPAMPYPASSIPLYFTTCHATATLPALTASPHPAHMPAIPSCHIALTLNLHTPSLPHATHHLSPTLPHTWLPLPALTFLIFLPPLFLHTCTASPAHTLTIPTFLPAHTHHHVYFV